MYTLPNKDVRPAFLLYFTVCTREGRVKTDTTGKRKDKLKQVETFKYLGSIISETGGCEEEARHRVGAGWGKWREMSGIVCDKRMPIMLKVSV